MIVVGREIVTEVRIGNDPIGTVMRAGVEVWPNKPLSAWVIGLTDQGYLFQRGINWVMNTPDLSAKPKPMKGCLILNPYVDITDALIANIVIHDGTDWACSVDATGGTYAVPSHTGGSKTPAIQGWWNSPTGAADAQAKLDTGYSDSGLWMLAWAAPDGIHMKLVDNNGSATDFVEPYPAGVSMADMPPTETDPAKLNP